MDWAALHSSIDALEETAEAYIVGSLSPDEKRGYEQHLRECPACQELVEIVREFVEVFRRTVPPPLTRIHAV